MLSLWRFVVVICVGAFLHVEGYEHSIAICSVFKDEAPWLKEWIEYHKMLGVTHFRLYNNESSDDYLEVLSPYLKTGELTLLDWPNEEGDLENWASIRQWAACIDGLVHLKNRAKWVALIDIDEFIVPLEDSDLALFLENYEEYPAVVLNWQCFGTSFVSEIPQGKLMIEALTFKASELSYWNKPVKSIIRPEFVDIDRKAWPPHTAHYFEDKIAVFPDLIPRKECLDIDEWEIHPSKAVINHYVHRTEDFFWEKKLEKKKHMKNWAYLKDPEYVERWYFECNEIEDRRILRFASQLRERME